MKLGLDFGGSILYEQYVYLKLADVNNEQQESGETLKSFTVY